MRKQGATHVHRHVGLLLLVQLAAVDELLQGPGAQQTVHVHVAVLAQAERAVLGLREGVE